MDKGPKEINKAFKPDCRSLGVVIYGDNNMYAQTETENELIHIKIEKETVYKFLLDKMRKEFSAEPIAIIVGHEHGENNKKCHFQCCMKFAKRFNRTIKPFATEINGIKIIGMFQRGKHPAKLWNYCKKDGDYYASEPDDVCDNVYERLVKEKERSVENITDLMCAGDPKTFVLFGDKIINNYENLVKQRELPKFQWIFPQHLLDYLTDDEHDTDFDRDEKDKYYHMLKWFKEHCITEDVTRRQCLFLVSTERGMGKTEFAKRLVPHEDYFIYCRGTLDAGEFKRKAKTAKLIILDDVSYIGTEKEMWKALISGEAVNICTKYHNYPWKGGLPCIVLTNELSTVSYWTNSNLFNSQCCFINIRKYLGPDGTRPVFLDKKDIHFDVNFIGDMNKWEKEKADKKQLNK